MKRTILVLFIISMLIVGYSFSDEGPSSWAIDYVDDIKGQDILDTNFFYNYTEPITRKEFAYLGVKLYEYSTGDIAETGDLRFVDTDDKWVMKAKTLGIVNGYPDGTFRPYNSITRQELAVLFVNTFKASRVDYSTHKGEKFLDDDLIADWAKNSVYIAKSNGIINGIGNNTFNPSGDATKEQSLIMFNKGQVLK